MPYLRKKVQAGLPVVAFSAGMILCGPNILTANDLNTVATSHFDGLNVTPFNFFAHYPKDAHGQSVQDAWLSDYFIFNDNPVIMLCDGAYVTIEGPQISPRPGEGMDHGVMAGKRNCSSKEKRSFFRRQKMADEQWIPGNKNELMQEIEREWKSLMQVVAKLQQADKMTTPDEGAGHRRTTWPISPNG